MRYRCISGAFCIAVATSMPVGAQTPTGPGIYGVYDPATKVFTPIKVESVATTSTAAEPKALVSRTGKIRFKIHIKVKSGSPETTLPSCSVSFSHTGIVHNYTEQQSVQGTRTGNNALCDVALFFDWTEANSANPVTMSISVNVTPRSHSEQLPPIPLPANDSTTVIDIDVTA
jgi:hypothetical protein